MNITEHNFKQLQLLYNKAIKYGHSSFTFEDEEILTDYARYVIEWLTPKFINKQ